MGKRKKSRRRGILQVRTHGDVDQVEDVTENLLSSPDPEPEEPVGLDPLWMPELIEAILKHLRRKDLKNCRLVSSLWNEEGSRLLRRLCHVRLYDRNMFNFERLLRCNSKLRLPNPFGQYHVSIRKLDDRNLARILNYNTKAGITWCSLVVSQTSTNSYYQKRLIALLESNNHSLNTLMFNMYRGIYLGYTPIMEGKLPLLPNLTKVVIKSKARGTVIPQESINFIAEIIKAAPELRHLEITCDQEDVLIQLFQLGRFGNLDSFHSEGLTLRQLDALALVKCPNLTKLHLKYNDATLHQEMVNPTKFSRLLVNFANTLEELSISWIGNEGTWSNSFPFCPNLKSLTLYLYEGSLAAINPTCLPALEEFSVIEYMEFQESTPSPHHTVKSFSIEDFSGMYFEDEFDTLVNFVDKQFPRLTSLSICMVLNDSSVRTIVTALPLLVKLQLRVGQLVTEEAFTGIPLGIDIESHLRTGLDLKEIRVFPALTHMRCKNWQLHRTGRLNPQCFALIYSLQIDMTDLDVSNFPAGPSITNVAIKYGLAAMPSLEYLTMNWDSGLSIDVIVGSLSHLKCLRLSDWHHFHPSSSIFELKKLMPQLEIPGYSDD